MRSESKSMYPELEMWLRENVIVYEDLREAVIHSFEVDWTTLVGLFAVTIDGDECPFRFRFSLMTATGRPEVYCPMFHSPLGVPASYAAVNLPERVHTRITAAIGDLIPQLKPMGRDPETGEEITVLSSPKDRGLSRHEIEIVKGKLGQPGFSVRLVFPPS